MTLAEEARRLNLRASSASRCQARGRRAHRRVPALILVTDEVRLPDPSPVVSRLPRGSAVILRHYGLPAADRAALAVRLRRLTRARKVLLLIAAHGGAPDDLARAVGADGIHLPEWQVRRGPWRALAGCKPAMLVTAAAHSWTALRRARAWRVDAVLVSPVFATLSHPGARPLGVLRFAAWARIGAIAVYGLGGINHRTATRLRPTRASGLAGIGGLL